MSEAHGENLMADNYLENKMEAYRARKDREAKEHARRWRKRMDAYRKRMEEAEKAPEPEEYKP